MYEVHQNIADQWVLYHFHEDSFDAIAWFLDREDAEYACAMFEKRSAAYDVTLAMSRTH
jgi:hypothetical protein